MARAPWSTRRGVYTRLLGWFILGWAVDDTRLVYTLYLARLLMMMILGGWAVELGC